MSENIHPNDMPAFIKIMVDSAAGILYSETEFRIRDSYGSVEDDLTTFISTFN